MIFLPLTAEQPVSVALSSCFGRIKRATQHVNRVRRASVCPRRPQSPRAGLSDLRSTAGGARFDGVGSQGWQNMTKLIPERSPPRKTFTDPLPALDIDGHSCSSQRVLLPGRSLRAGFFLTASRKGGAGREASLGRHGRAGTSMAARKRGFERLSQRHVITMMTAGFFGVGFS
jgi:hypothetical protein